MPTFFGDHLAVSLVIKDGDENKDDRTKVRRARVVSGVRIVFVSARVQEIRRRLEPAQWQTAWENFAVAAEILGVLDMKSSMLHKRHMQVLTENAVKEGRKPLFSVLYDELLR